MKKLIITLSALIQFIYLSAQTNTLDAKKVIVRDSLILSGKKISGLVSDSALVGDNTKIAGLQALKEYIANRLTTAVITETDPSVASYIKSISTTDISSWNAAYNFSNGFNISNYYPTLDNRYLQLSNFTWDNLSNKPFNFSTAYSLSNDIKDSLTARYTKAQSDARYLQSYSETDPIYTASSWYTTTNNSTNWNSAYSFTNSFSIANYYATLDTRYLQLSGGTLTGALIGTSASFTSDLTISASATITTNGLDLLNGVNRFIRFGSATNYFYTIGSVNDDFVIKEAGVTDRLRISYPSGLVTVSSLLTNSDAQVNGTIYAYRPASNTILEGGAIYMSGGYTSLRVGTDQSFNIDNYNGNNRVNALKIYQNGAAVFNSTVTAASLNTSAYIGLNLSGNYIRWNSAANNNADYYLGLDGGNNGEFILFDNSNATIVFATQKSSSVFTLYRNLNVNGGTVTASNVIANWQGYTPSSFALASHTHSTADITNLSSYSGFDARYYTESEVNGLLSGYVPTSRTLTINGTTHDLSANRSFTVTASGTFSLYPGVGLQLYSGTIETQNLSSSPVYYIKEKLAFESTLQTSSTAAQQLASYTPQSNEQGVMQVIVSGFDGTTSDKITYTTKVFYWKSGAGTVDIYESGVDTESYKWGSPFSGLNVTITTSGGNIVVNVSGTNNGCYWTAYTRAYPNYPAN